MKRSVFAAAVFSLAMCMLSETHAGVLTTIGNTNATALANALLANGAGGINITSAVLSSNGVGADASSGIFTTSGTNNYGLLGTGAVISTGRASQDGTTGAFISGVTTAYGLGATTAQTNLLHQVSPGGNFLDVTQLTITFDASATTTQIFFNTVFASAEYPVYAIANSAFVDGFGLFLNSTNIAFVGGQPVNINNTNFVNTAFPTNGGVNGTLYQTTPLQGLLVSGGSAVITYSGAVTAGSTGNTLIFIVGDKGDASYDTTAFIQGFGNADPASVNAVPEPATLTMSVIAGICGLGCYGSRRWKRKA